MPPVQSPFSTVDCIDFYMLLSRHNLSVHGNVASSLLYRVLTHCQNTAHLLRYRTAQYPVCILLACVCICYRSEAVCKLSDQVKIVTTGRQGGMTAIISLRIVYKVKVVCCGMVNDCCCCCCCTGAKVTEETTLPAALLMNLIFLCGLFTFAVVLGFVSEEIKSQLRAVKAGNYPGRSSI